MWERSKMVDNLHFLFSLHCNGGHFPQHWHSNEGLFISSALRCVMHPLIKLFVRKKRDDVNLGNISNNQSDRGSFPQNTVVYQIWYISRLYIFVCLILYFLLIYIYYIFFWFIFSETLTQQRRIVYIRCIASCDVHPWNLSLDNLFVFFVTLVY